MTMKHVSATNKLNNSLLIAEICMCLKALLKLWQIELYIMMTDGSSLRRMWRRAGSAGPSRTWPHSRCTRCLSCGRASCPAQSCSTLTAPTSSRSQVGLIRHLGITFVYPHSLRYLECCNIGTLCHSF